MQELFDKFLEENNLLLIKNTGSDRSSKEYKEWRNQVLERDDYTCQCCGGDKYIEVHHIFNYKDYPLLRCDVNNGISLCKWCHGKYHSYYGKSATAKSLMEFYKRFECKNIEDISINNEDTLETSYKPLLNYLITLDYGGHYVTDIYSNFFKEYDMGSLLLLTVYIQYLEFIGAVERYMGGSRNMFIIHHDKVKELINDYDTVCFPTLDMIYDSFVDFCYENGYTELNHEGAEYPRPIYASELKQCDYDDYPEIMEPMIHLLCLVLYKKGKLKTYDDGFLPVETDEFNEMITEKMNIDYLASKGYGCYYNTTGV